MQAQFTAQAQAALLLRASDRASCRPESILLLLCNRAALSSTELDCSPAFALVLLFICCACVWLQGRCFVAPGWKIDCVLIAVRWCFLRADDRF